MRERFTRTAEEFARFALSTRHEEAERLVSLLAPRGDEAALDLACGPGTFTRALASRARFVYGFDFTPAMLAKAEQATARAGLGNVAFACADGNALPVSNAALGLAACGYSFHHFLEPARPMRELARVLRRGGRVGLVDIIVPEGADAGLNNRIERTRDPSHARTLTAAEFRALLEAAGLRVLASEIGERLRQFDDWMRIMGAPPGTPMYAETRRLMEASMAGDLAGFRPRFVRASPAGSGPAQDDNIEYVQTSLFVVAEKVG